MATGRSRGRYTVVCGSEVRAAGVLAEDFERCRASRHWRGRVVTEFQPESEVIAWIALRRLNTGEVVRLADHWLNSGRPVPCYLTDTLHQLTRARLVTLAEPAPDDLTRRATLTESGRARYTDLQGKYGATHLARAELDVRVPEIPTTQMRACLLASDSERTSGSAG